MNHLTTIQYIVEEMKKMKSKKKKIMKTRENMQKNYLNTQKKRY